MIRCHDVRKTYTLGNRAVEALRGVDLVIDEPGFYAIMGQSGSGKTTLLQLIGALDRIDAGTIEVAGRRIHDLKERAATEFRRREIGIVFQGFNLISTMSAGDNVELPGVLAGQDPAWLRARRDELLDRLGLAGRAEHRPEALSGGEQQRVAIARALLFSPPVLLADEPTGNLDSESSRDLWKLLGEIAGERRMTILMVTHEPAAASHCRRIFVMRDGRITGSFDNQLTGGEADASVVASRYQQLVGQA